MTHGRLRLTIFVAAVLLLPALIAHLLLAQRDFDAKPIAKLRNKKPDVVLLGDSILGRSVDPQRFAEKTGARHVALQRFTADRRARLESQGCTFIDLTNDPALTGGLYLKDEDDRIRPAAKRAATEICAEKLGPLLRGK